MNYINHLLIVISKITRCVSISGFASLIGISIGITTSATGLNICGTTTGIKKYKSKITKKKKKLYYIVLLAESKLHSVWTDVRCRVPKGNYLFNARNGFFN